MLYMPLHRKGPPTEALAAEYMAGATTVELGKKYGMHPQGVNGRLTRAGIPIRPARRRCIADGALNEIVSAYENGMSIADVADTFKGSRSSIQRALRDSGVEMHPHGLRSRTIQIPSDPFVLGYIAGLLDGEGHLQIKKGSKSIGCKMSIYSTTPEIMQWLLKNFGGAVRYDTKRTIKHGWLPIGAWSLYRAQDVAALLVVLLPHLIIKREKAEHALTLFRAKFKIQDSPPTMTQSKRSK